MELSWFILSQDIFFVIVTFLFVILLIIALPLFPVACMSAVCFFAFVPFIPPVYYNGISEEICCCSLGLISRHGICTAKFLLRSTVRIVSLRIFLYRFKYENHLYVLLILEIQILYKIVHGKKEVIFLYSFSFPLLQNYVLPKRLVTCWCLLLPFCLHRPKKASRPMPGRVNC